MTDQAGADEQNKRVLQAVSYLIEWSKHVVTAAAALMVLCVTLLKDLAKGIRAPLSLVMEGSLVVFYLSMVVAVWLALGLVRQCANTVLTTATHVGTGDELAKLKTQLTLTQVAFLVGLACFSVVALSVLVSWAHAGEGTDAPGRTPIGPASSAPANDPCESSGGSP